MKATIRSSGTTFVEQLMVADSFFARLRGLLGMKALPTGGGLWLKPCKGVHTFGMKFPIDVIMLDRENRVIAIVNSLPPNRMTAIYVRAATVLEIPAAAAAAAKLSIGDSVLISV